MQTKFNVKQYTYILTPAECWYSIVIGPVASLVIHQPSADCCPGHGEVNATVIGLPLHPVIFIIIIVIISIIRRLVKSRILCQIVTLILKKGCYYSICTLKDFFYSSAINPIQCSPFQQINQCGLPKIFASKKYTSNKGRSEALSHHH